MKRYTVETAMEALGLTKKTQLAVMCECHVQSFYMLAKKKNGEMGARLNLVIKLLVRIKGLLKRIDELEHVLETKNAIIKELKK